MKGELNDKHWFFGWHNFKLNFLEFKKVYSAQPSYYSKKRIESGIAFLVLQWGMISFLVYKITTDNMSMMDMTLWAGIEGVICGYTLNKIEAAKTVDGKPADPGAPKETI